MEFNSPPEVKDEQCIFHQAHQAGARTFLSGIPRFCGTLSSKATQGTITGRVASLLPYKDVTAQEALDMLRRKIRH